MLRWIFVLVALHSACAISKPQYRPFNQQQYFLLPLLAAGNLLIFKAFTPSDTNWKGGILIDESVRGGLRLGSRGARDFADTTSDLMVLSLMAFPFVFDSGVSLWLDPKTRSDGIQSALISVQSMLVTALFMQLTKKVVARERPLQRECGADPNYSSVCGRDDSRASFYSGHSALAFTGAGLACVNRKVFKLKGGNAFCYAGVTLASLVGILRIMADKHYLSDVLVGGAMGWISGYYLPKWLHYSEDMQFSVLPPTGEYPWRLAWNLQF